MILVLKCNNRMATTEWRSWYMQKRFPISQAGARNANGYSFGFVVFLEQLDKRREGKGEKDHLVEVTRLCAWRTAACPPE